MSATAAADYINLIRCLQSSSPTWHYPCAKGGGARLSFAHAGLEACSCLYYICLLICWWWAQWCCELWLGSVEKSERGGRLRPRGAPARSAAEKRRAKNSKGGGAARDPPNALGVPLTGDHCFGRRGAVPAQAGEKRPRWARRANPCHETNAGAPGAVSSQLSGAIRERISRRVPGSRRG